MMKFQLNVSHAMALKVGGMLLHFSIAALLSRWYSPSVYGEFAYFLSWVTVLALISSLGFDWLLMREVSYLQSHGPACQISALVSWGHRLSAVTAVTVSVVLVVSSQWWASPSTNNKVLPFVALALPWFTWLRVRQGALQALNFPVASQLPINVFLPLLFLSGIVGCKVLGLTLSPHAVLVLYLFCLLIVFLFVDLWFRATLRKYPPATPANLPLQKDWLYSALRLLASSGLGLFIYQLPILLAGLMIDAASAGIADVVVRGSLIIALPLSAVNLPLAPFVAGAPRENTVSGMQLAIKHATRVAFLGAAILSLGYIAASWYILPFLLGPVYRLSLVWLWVLAVGQIVNVGVGPVVLILNMRGHEMETLKGMLLGLIVIGGSSWLFRPWRLGGVLTAYTLGIIVWNVYLFFRVRAILDIDSSVLTRPRKA